MGDFFIPEVGQLTHKFSLSLGESIDVMTRFFGVLVKILWAFLWQEFFLSPKWIFHPIALHVGASVTPLINDIGNLLSGFPQTDIYMKEGKDVYPGWRTCNVHSPHALWHQESADGLADLILLVDYLVGLIKTE